MENNVTNNYENLIQICTWIYHYNKIWKNNTYYKMYASYFNRFRLNS